MFWRKRSGAVVIQTAYMGDVILTTPLLTALAALHGPVDVVATPQSATLLDTHPAVREVIRYDKRGNDRGWPGLRRVASQLRKRAYSAAYLPHRSWRSATMVLLARIPERIGFEDSPAAPLYTRRLPRPVQAHETARLWSLAGLPLGAPVPPVTLGLTDEDNAEAERWLSNRGITGDFVALGAGSPWGAKRWPYYPELVAQVEGPVVAIGGPTDAALGDAIEAAAPGRAHSACGQVGPRTSTATHRARGGDRDQRFVAAAPRAGDAHADGGAVRPDGAVVRLRSARSRRHLPGRGGPPLPAVRDLRTGGVSPRPSPLPEAAERGARAGGPCHGAAAGRSPALTRDALAVGFDAARAFRNRTGLGNYSRRLLTGLAAAAPELRATLYSPAPPRPEFAALGREPARRARRPCLPPAALRAVADAGVLAHLPDGARRATRRACRSITACRTKCRATCHAPAFRGS